MVYRLRRFLSASFVTRKNNKFIYTTGNNYVNKAYDQTFGLNLQFPCDSGEIYFNEKQSLGVLNQ